MAITTLDGVSSNQKQPVSFSKQVTGTLVIVRPHSTFYLAGYPAAAAVPSTGLSGTNLTTYAGQMPFTNPSSGNTYLTRFEASSLIGGQLLLCDRLWHNNVPVTSADAAGTTGAIFTGSQQIPARDANGLTSGTDVMVGVECITAFTGGSVNMVFSVNYNNTLGVSGVGVNIQAPTTTTIVGTFFQIGLANGDVGVSKVNSLTISNDVMTAGAVSVVAYRILARLDLQDKVTSSIDALTAGFPKMYDNSVPFLIFVPSTTTTGNIQGTLNFAQG